MLNLKDKNDNIIEDRETTTITEEEVGEAIKNREFPGIHKIIIIPEISKYRRTEKL